MQQSQEEGLLKLCFGEAGCISSAKERHEASYDALRIGHGGPCRWRTAANDSGQMLSPGLAGQAGMPNTVGNRV